MEHNQQSVYRILLIDDDTEFCGLMGDYLEMHGFSVTPANTGLDGVQASSKDAYDLILLDMLLPDMSGLDVLRRIRLNTGVPIIILSAHNEETDRIVTLELGADDYVAKAFSARELLARIRAVLRRFETTPYPEPSPPCPSMTKPSILTIRGLTINPGTMRASIGNRDLDLTVVEFNLLHTMAKEPGRIFSRDALLNIFTEKEWSKIDRSVDVHVSSLRRKLNDDAKNPLYLKTIRGIGYTFLRDGEA